MSARIPGSLMATLLLAACATSPTYHSDRGGDYYYGTSAADVVIDAAPGYPGWGFGGGFGYGCGYGGYGGYYSPWAWHGGYGYGYPPWWRYGHAPIVERPHHDRHPAPRNALRYSPRSNVRAEREQPGAVRIDASAAPRAFPAAPRAEPRSDRGARNNTMLPSSGYAPVPRAAPQRADDRHSPMAVPAPRAAPRPVAAPSPVAAPRSAPALRTAPAAPPVQRAPAPQPRPSGKHGADRR